MLLLLRACDTSLTRHLLLKSFLLQQNNALLGAIKRGTRHGSRATKKWVQGITCKTPEVKTKPAVER